jgi:hypothetical protein
MLTQPSGFLYLRVSCCSCAKFYTNLGGQDAASHYGAHTKGDQACSLNRWRPPREPGPVTNYSQSFNLHVLIEWRDDTDHTKNMALDHVSIALEAIQSVVNRLFRARTPKANLRLG